MSAEKVSPLNNPSSKRAAVAAVKDMSSKATATAKGEDRGESRGGKGEGKKNPVCALVVCSACGEMQNIVFGFGNVPSFHRCVNCGDLMPTASYKLLAYGWPPLVDAITLRNISHRRES